MDDVYEQVLQRAEAEGKTLEEAANDAVRLGLSEDRWQKLVKRGRNYSREMAEAATDEDAIQPSLEVEPGRCMMRSKSLAKLEEPPTAAENLPQGGEKCSPTRVLVVDDEALIRWSVAETLGEQGWQVTEAADAESAMVAFPEIAEASGLVFLDLRLPDSDDLHVLAAMRRLSPRTPVILMTAHGTPDLADAARALGAFAVIDKPFDMGELGPLAERASGRRRALSIGSGSVDTTRSTS